MDLLNGLRSAPPPALLLGVGAGAAAEEWMFSVVLLWRWLGWSPGVEPGVYWTPPRLRAAAVKLSAVALYFAALHWPQPPPHLLTAFLGGLVLGVVLLRTRNFALIAILHVLFNLKALLG